MLNVWRSLCCCLFSILFCFRFYERIVVAVEERVVILILIWTLNFQDTLTALRNYMIIYICICIHAPETEF